MMFAVMRNLLLTAGAMACALSLLAADKASEKIVFEAKPGNVTFLHQKHSEREKESCKACHDKIWPQKKASVNFKVHKAAEAKKISCASETCHVTGGRAFAATVAANCKKCHVKGAAAPAKAD